MEREKNMIIAAPERWDEACFSVPATRALAKSGLASGILCREEQVPLWEAACELPTISYTSKDSISQITTKIEAGWKASLLWGEHPAAKAFAKAAIPRRLGPSAGKIEKFLTESPLVLSEEIAAHRVRHYLGVSELLGVPAATAEFFFPLETANVKANETLLLCLDSDFGPSYEWPLESWKELSAQLLENSLNLHIVTGRGGRKLGEALSSHLGASAESVEISCPGAALPLLGSFPVTVSVDGSLPHLSALGGSTCVTIFGPNDPVWKRPLGKRHAVVQRSVECSPCFSEKCRMDLRCQNEITAKALLRALEQARRSAFD